MIYGKINCHAEACHSVTPKIRERHLAEWHRNLTKKSAKSGTAHAAVQENGDESEKESATSLDFKKD